MLRMYNYLSSKPHNLGFLPVTITSHILCSACIITSPGNNVLYNWTLSDGAEFLQSTDRILSHTFSSRGQYQVNVTVYNSVSFKENTTDVIVEDEILGLSASTVVQGQSARVKTCYVWFYLWDA